MWVTILHSNRKIRQRDNRGQLNFFPMIATNNNIYIRQNLNPRETLALFFFGAKPKQDQFLWKLALKILHSKWFYSDFNQTCIELFNVHLRLLKVTYDYYSNFHLWIYVLYYIIWWELWWCVSVNVVAVNALAIHVLINLVSSVILHNCFWGYHCESKSNDLPDPPLLPLSMFNCVQWFEVKHENNSVMDLVQFDIGHTYIIITTHSHM